MRSEWPTLPPVTPLSSPADDAILLPGSDRLTPRSANSYAVSTLSAADGSTTTSTTADIPAIIVQLTRGQSRGAIFADSLH